MSLSVHRIFLRTLPLPRIAYVYRSRVCECLAVHCRILAFIYSICVGFTGGSSDIDASGFFPLLLADVESFHK